MLTTDRIGGSALCLVALFVMWESRALPLGSVRHPGPGYFPVLLAVLLLGLGALVWAMGRGGVPVAGVGWGEARRALRQAVASFPDARLTDPVPGREYPFYVMLYGAIEHAHYHAGQIEMLMLAQGVRPAASPMASVETPVRP